MKSKSNQNKMGIYIISNSIDSRVYIGSAIHVNYRKNVHFCQLKKNNHHSIHLQRFFNKYGKDSLRFDILEIVDDIDILNQREQYFLDKYNSVSPNGFNIRSDAKTNFGVKHSKESIEKRKQTLLSKGGFYRPDEETKKRISNSMKLLVKTPEHCKNLSKAREGIKLNETTKEKIRIIRTGTKAKESTVLKRSKTYQILNPDNILITIINNRKFCRDNNLGYSSMQRVLTKKQKEYNGYKLP